MCSKMSVDGGTPTVACDVPQEPVDVWERAARLRAMISRIGASM